MEKDRGTGSRAEKWRKKISDGEQERGLEREKQDKGENQGAERERKVKRKGRRVREIKKNRYEEQ